MQAQDFRRDWLPLGDAVYRVALYILEDPDDASDAVQDLFLKLWNTREKLDSVQNPKAYAITLIRNLCIDRIRSAKRFFALRCEEDLPEAGFMASEPDILASREKLRRVLAIIEGLPDRQRQLVRLRLLEGMDYSRIARKTGITENNARVLVSIARKTIKEQMKDERA